MLMERSRSFDIVAMENRVQSMQHVLTEKAVVVHAYSCIGVSQLVEEVPVQAMWSIVRSTNRSLKKRPLHKSRDIRVPGVVIRMRPPCGSR
jgi:hypothetical protein